VFRPTLRTTTLQRGIWRNLALDLTAAIGVGVSTALINALLPTIARRGGLEPLGLSALAAAPFVANFLGAFAGRLGPRSPHQLALIRGSGAASLVLLFVLPSPITMVVVAVVFWVSLSFGGPFHLRLWGAMYPSRLRGRVMGVVGMGRAAAAAVAAFVGGIVADRIGGPTAVAIAGLIGVACAVALTGLRAAAAERSDGFSARESLRALRERPVLSRLALAQGFYGGGLIAAVPLFALVHVDRLDLSLAEVGVIGILAAASTTVAFPIWGAVADRRGPLVVLRLGGVIGLTSLVAYALAAHVAVLWVAALATGTASAAIDVGIAAVVSEQTSLRTRAAAMAGWNAFTGARGIVAAFLMSALVQLGIVDVTSGLLVCAAASAVGVVLYARTKPAVPVETRAWEMARAPASAA
jgi:MFS family permease